MNGKMRMIMGITLVLGIFSITFLAAPIQAHVNGTGNGDLLQTRDQERLRTQDCDSNCEMDQKQEQERLKTQHCDCICNCTQTQYHSRERTNECATIRICNCTTNLEPYRYQYREKRRSN